MILPSQQNCKYCEQKGWHGNALFLNNLRPKNAESGRNLEPLPQLIGENYFAGLTYYPISIDERAAHAFWDCLGETTFRPSGQLLFSVYCSRIQPLHSEESSLLKVLEGIHQGNVPLKNFPHKVFDRWDFMVHKPDTMDHDGDKEPSYACRFVLRKGKLKNQGVYSSTETEWIHGWGKPCVDTLLMSPAYGKEGSFFKEEIYEEGTEKEITIHTQPRKNIDLLLQAFSEITKSFNEGVYDNEHEERYDFGDATGAAINIGEQMTGQVSKLVDLPPYERN